MHMLSETPSLPVPRGAAGEKVTAKASGSRRRCNPTLQFASSRAHLSAGWRLKVKPTMRDADEGGTATRDLRLLLQGAEASPTQRPGHSSL